jgi:hypothetical protein
VDSLHVLTHLIVVVDHTPSLLDAVVNLLNNLLG